MQMDKVRQSRASRLIVRAFDDCLGPILGLGGRRRAGQTVSEWRQCRTRQAKKQGRPPPGPALPGQLALGDRLLLGRILHGRAGIGCGLAIVDKRRVNRGEVAEMTVIGDVSGKACIIVDDICDTAGTLCKAAEVLIQNGAVEVHSYITHGVLSGPAVERVTKSVMKSLVVTDSIEATAAVKNCKNIRIVPTAPMFAQAILNIWSGNSVSSLFDPETLIPIYEGMYSDL